MRYLCQYGHPSEKEHRDAGKNMVCGMDVSKWFCNALGWLQKMWDISCDLGFLVKIKNATNTIISNSLTFKKSQVWHMALLFSTSWERNTSVAVRFQNVLKKKMQKHTSTVNRMGPLMIHNTTPFSSSSQHLKRQTKAIMLRAPFELFTTYRTISDTD